jgi:uncharacterized peroxidase-related enzyme
MTKDHLSPDSTAQIEDIAWIETVHPEEATGYVKSLYEGFQKQRGWIPNILKSTSIRPEVTRGWVPLFNPLMYGPSGLTRSQKEMIAVVVSAGNQCHY